MTETQRQDKGHVISPLRARTARGARYEWRVVDIPASTSTADARVQLTEHAEFGAWELVRSVLYVGGARRVWLRRRTMRVMRTDVA